MPVAAECLLPVEFIAVQLANSIDCAEWNTTRLFRSAVAVEQLLKQMADVELCPEFRNFVGTDQRFRFEVLATQRSETTIVLESLASGARISIDEPLYIEWADPPTPVPVVGPDRLLRSPGKVRVLAGPASLQRLRGL